MSATEMQSGAGFLADDGERVQCHECGRWFRALASHLTRAHGLSSEEYRALHGLPRTQSLTSSASQQLRHEIGVRRRDTDPTVMAALNGDAARAQRAAGFPDTPRRQASADRVAASKRRSARERLDAVIADAGFADLAEAAGWAEDLGLGWSGLAAALGGVGHTWLAEVGAERGVTLTAPGTAGALHSRRYLAAARDYRRQRGNLDAPAAWTTDDGVRLGRWLVARRNFARAGRQSWVMDSLDDIDPQWRTYGRINT